MGQPCLALVAVYDNGGNGPRTGDDRHTNRDENLLIAIENPFFEIFGFVLPLLVDFDSGAFEHAESELQQNQSASDLEAGKVDLQPEQ